MSGPSPVNKCPKCGAVMPDKAPEGLCPKCLLLGIAAPTDSGAGQSRPEPPALDAVAAAFPQLEILEFIGQGGMGCVFKARQPQLNRFVALKILPEALARDAAFAARFVREAQALAALNHPNIVTIHDFGQAGGFFFLLMEFVDGVNLRQALGAGRFTPEQALAVVPPICDALQFAHERGIVHRDIKPENLLLDRNGRVKIADFGIAKMIAGNGEPLIPGGGGDPGPKSAGDSAVEQGVAGTPQYMAPEQRSDPQRADHRADIYSLGVVLYELLTGELPGSKLQPPSRKVQIDVRLDEVVLRALEKEPQRRYQTAAELRTQVETITASGEMERHATSAAPVLPPRYIPRIVGVAVFVFVMLGVTVSTLVLPKSYVATTRILLRDDAAPADVAAEFERMQSLELLRKVAADLDLKSRWSGKSGRVTASDDSVIELLRRQMACRTAKNTSIMEVLFTSESPGEAAEVANKIAEIYRSSEGAAGTAIVDQAEPPLRPAKPNIPLNLAVGALVAIALASLAARLMLIARRRKGDGLTGKPGVSSIAQSEAGGRRPASGHSRLALGLFLTGTLGTLLLMTLSHRHEPALAFGGLALLLSLVFGYLSRRDWLGKGVAITTILLFAGAGLVVATLVWGISVNAFRRTRAEEAARVAHEKLAAAKHAAMIQRASNKAGFSEQEAGTLESLPPVVVETQPASGARDVAPGITEVRVRFSKEMADGSWSWATAWAGSTPELVEGPRYDPIHRTCIIKAKLEPGRTYAWWLNSEKFQNFRDKGDRPAVPYLLIFQTRGKESSL